MKEKIKYLKNDNNKENIEFTLDPIKNKTSGLRFNLRAHASNKIKSKEQDLRYVKLFLLRKKVY